MLQRQSKNNDLVIQVEGAGISKLEYYTDGLYKFETTYSPTIYIPSSELQKMNDGLLKSTVYIAVDNDNFSDGRQDRTINLRFAIWIGDEVSNDSWYKDEVEVLTKTVEKQEITIEENKAEILQLNNDIILAESIIAEKESEIEETTNALMEING